MSKKHIHCDNYKKEHCNHKWKYIKIIFDSWYDIQYDMNNEYLAAYFKCPKCRKVKTCEIKINDKDALVIDKHLVSCYPLMGNVGYKEEEKCNYEIEKKQKGGLWLNRWMIACECKDCKKSAYLYFSQNEFTKTFNELKIKLSVFKDSVEY